MMNVCLVMSLVFPCIIKATFEATNENSTFLNYDLLGKISEFVDDKTAFTLSSTSSELKQLTFDRLNRLKFQDLKKNCPGQFNYLTRNGNVILINNNMNNMNNMNNNDTLNSSARRSYESLSYGDTKEDVIRMLRHRRNCIYSMLSTKDLIADRLEEISIALPPKYTINSYGGKPLNYYNGHDAYVEKMIQKYYLSIKLLVDTGLVKKIRIHSAFQGHRSLNPLVEVNLLSFLLSIKVPSISFHVNIGCHDAFTEFGQNAIFLEYLYLKSQHASFQIPPSIQTHLIADFNPDLSRSHLPNLKSLTLTAHKLPDLIKLFPTLESITLKNMLSATFFLDTICRNQNPHLIELSLEFISLNAIHNMISTRSCLMQRKPYLRKIELAFFHKSFWNEFVIGFLENNSVIEEFSVELYSSILTIFPVEYTFLNRKYDGLRLKCFKITGSITSQVMYSVGVFIETHTSLTRVTIATRNSIFPLIDLMVLFKSIAKNKSIKVLDLTLHHQIKLTDIEDYLKGFVDACMILEGRSMILNGLSIESIIKDLNSSHSDLFAFKSLNEDGESGILIISSESLQKEFQ